MKITTAMIMKKEPCTEYGRKRVRELVEKGKTLMELLDLAIPAKDRIWVVTKFLDDKTNRKFALWCIRQCNQGGKKITEYIDTIEKFYAGNATQEQLCATASAAASETDWAAVHWAVGANSADRAADRAAEADSAARECQIEKLKELVREVEAVKEKVPNL